MDFEFGQKKFNFIVWRHTPLKVAGYSEKKMIWKTNEQ